MEDDILHEQSEFSILTPSSRVKPKFSGSSNTKVIKIKIQEVEELLNFLNDNKQVFFKNMNLEIKNNCDKLVKLMALADDDKSKRLIINLADKIFDQEEIMLPGTVGSYFNNCLHNFRNRNDIVNDIQSKNIEELRNYDDYNFLFYHNLPDKKLFTPIKLEKDNNKTIIMLDEADIKTFELKGDEKILLKNIGINYNNPLIVMSYNSKTKTFKEIYNNQNVPQEIEVRRNNLIVGGLIFVFIAAIIIVFYLSFNSNDEKKKGKKKYTI
jgi:hypothetical protein